MGDVTPLPARAPGRRYVRSQPDRRGIRRGPWNAHDPDAVAKAIHYPHVRIADNAVETWKSPEQFLAGSDPGRQRTWFQTRLDDMKVVQTTANGVNLTVKISRVGRDGKVLATDEGVFLVARREGTWKVQARSMMGT